LGIFDFFNNLAKPKRRTTKTKVVTQAVDTENIEQDKKKEDLKNLGILEKKLKKSPKVKETPQEEINPEVVEALKVKNPFIGK